MQTYIILIRGINVGGKNKISMSVLKNSFEEIGFKNVSTYIASGNVILDSDRNKTEIKKVVEDALPRLFPHDSKAIKVLVLSHADLISVINNKPKGFGDKPDKFHSDVIFLIDIEGTEALKVFKPRDGVDTIWPGKIVIYSQRLSTMRTKSRLNKIVGTVPYQSMTIRTWNTTNKLLGIIENRS